MVKTYSKKNDGDTNIAPNFKISEFACKDGTDAILLDSRLPAVLQRVRELAGNKAVNVSSGYRTPAYNAKIGGAPKSQHMEGKAADIQISGVAPETVCRCAETALAEAKIPGGICLYPTFSHIDTRETRWRAVDGGAKSVSGFTPMPSAPQPASNYRVEVTGAGLRLRTGPGTNFAQLVSGGRPLFANKGDAYTIARESKGDGAKLWGQISDGEFCGCWIALDYTRKK